MPLKSASQQRWMFATHPKMAKEWAAETPDMKNLPDHTGTAGAQKERVRALLRHACGTVAGAEPDRMARGGVRAPRAGVRAPHAGVRNPHAGIGKFVLPRYAEGGVAGDQPEPSITERIKNWLFGLGTLRKAAGAAQGPPESPQAASQREQQEKERRTAEDLDRQSRGLPPKVRITPGWSK